MLQSAPQTHMVCTYTFVVRRTRGIDMRTLIVTGRCSAFANKPMAYANQDGWNLTIEAVNIAEYAQHYSRSNSHKHMTSNSLINTEIKMLAHDAPHMVNRDSDSRSSSLSEAKTRDEADIAYNLHAPLEPNYEQDRVAWIQHIIDNLSPYIEQLIIQDIHDYTTMYFILEHIACNLRNLKKINLSNLKILHNSYHLHNLLRSDLLQEIDFSGSNIDHSGLSSLCSVNKHNFNRLKLNGCNNLQVHTLGSILSGVGSNLKELSLNHISNLNWHEDDPQQLLALIPDMPYMERINLMMNKNYHLSQRIPESLINAFITQAPNLKALYLSNITIQQELTVESVLLEELDVSNSELNLATFIQLVLNANFLKKINAHACNFTHYQHQEHLVAQLKQANCFPNLQELDLSYTENLPSNLLNLIVWHSKIELVSAAYTQFSAVNDDTFTLLAHDTNAADKFAYLDTIDVSNASNLPNHFLEFVARISANLKVLGLGKQAFDNLNFNISNKIELLDLSNIVTNKDIVKQLLTQSRHIQHLIIHKSKLLDIYVHDLPDFPLLYSLDLSKSMIDLISLCRFIAFAPNLEKVILDDCTVHNVMDEQQKALINKCVAMRKATKHPVIPQLMLKNICANFQGLNIYHVLLTLLPNIQALTLKTCLNRQDITRQKLPSFTNLTSITIAKDTKNTDKMLAAILSCAPNVQNIHLRDISELRSLCAFAELPIMKNVVNIDIFKCAEAIPANLILQLLNKCPNIRSLRMQECEIYHDCINYMPLPILHELTTLEFIQCKLQYDLFCNIFAKSPNIEELHVGDCCTGTSKYNNQFSLCIPGFDRLRKCTLPQSIPDTVYDQLHYLSNYRDLETPFGLLSAITAKNTYKIGPAITPITYQWSMSVDKRNNLLPSNVTNSYRRYPSM